MKRPSIQFYPADWRKDPALRACSIEARGLWIDMICIMHESENYGFLEINSRKISEKSLATMIGITPAKCRKYLTELEENGVLSIDDRGVIYSRRMVKDNELCEKRRASGKLGGNPALVKQKVNQTGDDLLNHPPKQIPTPSSSSSSSTSDTPLAPKGERANDVADFDDEPLLESNETKAEKIVKAYPRREKVADALCIVVNELNSGASFAEMLQGTQDAAAFIATVPSGAKNRYVPGALRFFRERRWMDDPSTLVRPPETPAPATINKPRGLRGSDVGI